MNLIRLFIILSTVTLTSLAHGFVCLSVQDGIRQVCVREKNLDSSCAFKDDQFAWDKKSCLFNSSEDRIMDILRLEELELIPKTVYEKHSSQKIAQNLIAKYFFNYDKPTKSKDLLDSDFDIYHSTSIIMAVKSEYLSAMLEQGFLNQHQTGKSSGQYKPYQRRVVEELLIQTSISSRDNQEYEDKINEIRPKYAYLIFDKEKTGIDKSFMSNQYGNLLIRFKDSVKKRSTFTNADSLDYALQRKGPEQYDLQNYKIHTFYYQTENLNLKRLSGYYEAQIWGPLQKEDIDYILVDCFEGVSSDKSAVIAELKSKNLKIPVYSCASIKNDLTWVRFAPKDLLYPTNMNQQNF